MTSTQNLLHAVEGAKKVEELKDKFFYQELVAGYQFFGRSPLDPPVDPNSLEEKVRSLAYCVCIALPVESMDPMKSDSYHENLDWCVRNLKDRIDKGIAYQDKHPAQDVHPLNLTTGDGKAALHRAVEGAAAETLRLLLTHRAERTKPNLNVKNAQGLTPFGLLLRGGLDTLKKLACFWTLVNHMLAHNHCDQSCPIPLYSLREMKTDPTKFASFQVSVARQNAKRIKEESQAR